MAARGYSCAWVRAAELAPFTGYRDLPRERLAGWWALVRDGWDPARAAVFSADGGRTDYLAAGQHRAAAAALFGPSLAVPVAFAFDRALCPELVELSDRGEFPFALEPPPPGVTVRA